MNDLFVLLNDVYEMNNLFLSVIQGTLKKYHCKKITKSKSIENLDFKVISLLYSILDVNYWKRGTGIITIFTYQNFLLTHLFLLCTIIYF